ncbi:MAG: universal stress protein [Pseudomonadota bacterium]
MFKSILLCVDLNDPESSEKPCLAACKLAKDHGAELHVLNVIPDYGMPIVGSHFDAGASEGMEGQVLTAMEKWAKDAIDASLSPKLHTAHGTIYDQIIKFAAKQNCDAIVLGAHRPVLKDYLVGPNAARVVRHSTQSVFVIR